MYLTTNTLPQENNRSSAITLGGLAAEDTELLRVFWTVLAPRIKDIIEDVNKQLACLYPADPIGSRATGKLVASCLDEAHWCSLFVRLEPSNNKALVCLIRDGIPKDVVLSAYRLIFLELTDVVFDELQLCKVEAVRQSRLTLKAIGRLMGRDLEYVMSFYGSRYVNEEQYKERILGGTGLVARLAETINDSMLCLANLERQSDAVQGAGAMTSAVTECLNASLEKLQMASDEIVAGAKASSNPGKGGATLPESLIHLSGAICDIRKGISTISTCSDQSVGVTTEVLRWISRSADSANRMISRTLMCSTEPDKFLLGLEQAKIEHLVFCKSLMDVVIGIKPLPESDPPNQHTCKFGIWYNSRNIKDTKGCARWLAINEPHEKVHVFTREAINALRAGDKKRALRALFGVHAESKRTIMALEEYARYYSEEQALVAAE